MLGQWTTCQDMVKDSLWQHGNWCYQPILLTINWFRKVCLVCDLCLINDILGIYPNSFFDVRGGPRKACIHITKNMRKGEEANVNAMFLMRVSMLHSFLLLCWTWFTCWTLSHSIMCLCVYMIYAHDACEKPIDLDPHRMLTKSSQNVYVLTYIYI